jgi:3-oxoacyl-[acyl-carrier protein] reductase
MSAPKRVVITGASRGIGRGIAERFARDGHRLLLVARDPGTLADASAALAPYAAQLDTLAIDLTTGEAPEAVIERADERLGGLDVLVSNAGAAPQGSFLELAAEAWPEGFALKMFAAASLIRAAWPRLKASRGSVVIIGGATARTPERRLTLVSAINSGLVAMMKSIAEQGIDDGIRVNLVEPGVVDTERRARLIARWAEAEGMSVDAYVQGMAARVRSRRIGRPRDIANAVAFLASEEADWIHGAVLDVDGGQTKGT